MRLGFCFWLTAESEGLAETSRSHSLVLCKTRHNKRDPSREHKYKLGLAAKHAIIPHSMLCKKTRYCLGFSVLLRLKKTKMLQKMDED